MVRTVDDIVESYAASLGLHPEKPSTIDRIIEVLATGASWSKEQKELLRQVANEKDYSGNNPNLMLLLYDVLGGRSKKALAYGIQAFEMFERDPKKLVGLENPYRLVEYVIATAEGLEELFQLKDTLLVEGHFYSMDDPKTYYFGRTPLFPKENLIKPVLLVANEIAYRLRDVDVRKLTKEEIDAMEPSELSELTKQWNIRLKAHEAIVIAYQVMASQTKSKKAKNTATVQALEALAAYESLAGTYQAHGFTMKLMEAYAKIKYVDNKLSTGEIPENLKADLQAIGAAAFWGRMDWDQYFRRQWFGTKEPEWKKWERQREEAKRSGRARAGEFADRIETLLRDPWSYYANELELLGLTKDMSYEDARATFRKGIMARRSTFIRQDIGTPEYETAMRETAAILGVWNKVQPLYLQNQKP